jgi:hypothetical protein
MLDKRSSLLSRGLSNQESVSLAKFAGTQGKSQRKEIIHDYSLCRL